MLLVLMKITPILTLNASLQCACEWLYTGYRLAYIYMVAMGHGLKVYVHIIALITLIYLCVVDIYIFMVLMVNANGYVY